MRTGAAHDHAGYFHELALYESDDELLSIVVPFLEGGLAAGEPTIVTFAEPNATLLRRAIGEPVGLRYLDGTDQYARPAATIKEYRDLFAQHVAAGATQIRVVGDVPHPGTGHPWDVWARYEAVINRAYDDFPLWGLCPYDLRITPDPVLDEVLRTHPQIVVPAGGHERNPRFEDPGAFLRARRNSFTDPLEARQPAIELTDPAPAAARQAAIALCATTSVDPAAIDDLAVAVSEVVANAKLHGQGPVRFRLWADADRVIATVTDRGDGPDDPFIGLLPVAPGAPDGRGLWIVHQLCQHVTMQREDDGFTVRLAVGTPRLAA